MNQDSRFLPVVTPEDTGPEQFTDPEAAVAELLADRRQLSVSRAR